MRLLALIVVAVAASARAADAPAPVDAVEVGDVTSRPGIGDAVLAVPRGAVLVNPGLTIAGPPGTGADTSTTAPDFLIRVGLAEGIEGRGAVIFEAGPDDVVTMTPSAAVGAQLLREDDVLPSLLGIGTLILPVTSAADLAVELRLSAGKGFGDFGVAANVATTIDGRGVGLSGTLGGGVGLPGGLAPFVEVFADTDLGFFAPNVGADAGLGVQITRNLAVDVSAGWTFLGEESLFVSVGASILWP